MKLIDHIWIIHIDRVVDSRLSSLHVVYVIVVVHSSLKWKYLASTRPYIEILSYK